MWTVIRTNSAPNAILIKGITEMARDENVRCISSTLVATESTQQSAETCCFETEKETRRRPFEKKRKKKQFL